MHQTLFGGPWQSACAKCFGFQVAIVNVEWWKVILSSSLFIPVTWSNSSSKHQLKFEGILRSQRIEYNPDFKWCKFKAVLASFEECYGITIHVCY